jgi:cell division protein FtsI (penicillin-binding protein 3)
VAERELGAGVKAAGAKGGVAIVADPATGEILALANVPTFDPNSDVAHRSAAWRKTTRNLAVSSVYEPGSTMKALFAAAALEERVTSPERQYFCENGRFRFANRIIRDSHPHGLLTFAEVIQYSSNICTSKVAAQLGAERWYRYLRAFGFGQRTGIDVPAEGAGILRPVESWALIDLATHSFGQGIAVTPLQMVWRSAPSPMGALMRPRRGAWWADGRVLARNPASAACVESGAHDGGAVAARGRGEGRDRLAPRSTTSTAGKTGRRVGARRTGHSQK